MALISSAFAENLRFVYSLLMEKDRLGQEATVTTKDLLHLSEEFQLLRSRTQSELTSLIDQLPRDDPISCPISLFRTMDYGRLETAHTRTLAWLLDPCKEHGFGSRLLESLLTLVGGQGAPIRVYNVASEYPIFGQGKKKAVGRIDVFAEGDWLDGKAPSDSWRLIIEAKIDADEGDGQLSRYEEWLDSLPGGTDLLLLFLATEGRVPQLGRHAWKTLTFTQLVTAFRSELTSLQECPGYHFLRFYLAGVLQDICGWPTGVRSNCPDPYSVLGYFEAALNP